MSVDSPIIGISTISGGGAATASVLAETGNPMLIGLVVGSIMIVAAGLLTRVQRVK